MTIQELQETYTPHTELEKEVLELIVSNASDYDSFERFLNELLTYGCVTGYISELVYYADTTAFTKRHAGEINELLNTTLSMYGLCTPKELFGDKWDCEDNLALDTQNQNLLAWFAMEETAREIGIALDLDLEAA
jgi:hypothetical protein